MGKPEYVNTNRPKKQKIINVRKQRKQRRKRRKKKKRTFTIRLVGTLPTIRAGNIILMYNDGDPHEYVLPKEQVFSQKILLTSGQDLVYRYRLRVKIGKNVHTI